MINLKSWWTFLVTERVGYRRPSPVTPNDLRMRQSAEARDHIAELRLHIMKKRIDALTPRIKTEWP